MTIFTVVVKYAISSRSQDYSHAMYKSENYKNIHFKFHTMVNYIVIKLNILFYCTTLKTVINATVVCQQIKLV